MSSQGVGAEALASLQPGALVALAIGDTSAAFSVDGHDDLTVDLARASALIAQLERDVSPRWVWWSNRTALRLAEWGIRPTRCWDLSAAHRLLAGGWRSGPDQIWARLHDFDVATIPKRMPVDLFSQAIDSGDPDEPVGPDGHLRPEWVEGEWSTSSQRTATWARLSLELQQLQEQQVRTLTDRPALRATVLSESAAELLCTELEVDAVCVA